ILKRAWASRPSASEATMMCSPTALLLAELCARFLRRSDRPGAKTTMMCSPTALLLAELCARFLRRSDRPGFGLLPTVFSTIAGRPTAAPRPERPRWQRLPRAGGDNEDHGKAPRSEPTLITAHPVCRMC